jgi:hypothetical protein
MIGYAKVSRSFNYSSCHPVYFTIRRLIMSTSSDKTSEPSSNETAVALNTLVAKTTDEVTVRAKQLVSRITLTVIDWIGYAIKAAVDTLTHQIKIALQPEPPITLDTSRKEPELTAVKNVIEHESVQTSLSADTSSNEGEDFNEDFLSDDLVSKEEECDENCLYNGSEQEDNFSESGTPLSPVNSEEENVIEATVHSIEKQESLNSSNLLPPQIDLGEQLISRLSADSASEQSNGHKESRILPTQSPKTSPNLFRLPSQAAA